MWYSILIEQREKIHNYFTEEALEKNQYPLIIKTLKLEIEGNVLSLIKDVHENPQPPSHLMAKEKQRCPLRGQGKAGGSHHVRPAFHQSSYWGSKSE